MLGTMFVLESTRQYGVRVNPILRGGPDPGTNQSGSSEEVAYAGLQSLFVGHAHLMRKVKLINVISSGEHLFSYAV
jgi:hypothetical protein